MLTVGPRFAVALLVLIAVAAAVAGLGRLGHGRQIVAAGARAAVQLAAVSLLIAAIVRSLWYTAAFVAVMCAVAAWTSGRRIGAGRSDAWWAAWVRFGRGTPGVLGELVVEPRQWRPCRTWVRMAHELMSSCPSA